MYQIDVFEYIYLLAGLPLIWIIYALFLRWKNKTQTNFARPELLELLSPNRSNFKPTLKIIFFSVFFLMLYVS